MANPVVTTVHLDEPLPWTTYWEGHEEGELFTIRECLVVPYASQVGSEWHPEAAEPLAGRHVFPGAELHTYPASGGEQGKMQVYTNMQRIASMTVGHP